MATALHSSAAPAVTVASLLDRHTVEGVLWRREGERIRCVACGHRCLIAEGKRGVCKVRFNQGGRLRAPYGYVAGLASDPVEKKPFFHVLPGSAALTFGMLGCDLHCAYCQNWFTSQSLRDPASTTDYRAATPEQLTSAARRSGARLMISSYNEPLITAEWAAAVFASAKKAGLICGFVSNGNGTPEVLDYLAPWLSVFKVDLKSFNDRHYRSLGGTLDTVLNTIRQLQQRRIWLEVLTLLVPGFNDDSQELRDIARFLAGLSVDIPWHITAFHPDYKMRENRQTTAADLLRAAEIGAAEGLRYVYAGNLPGQVDPWEDTRCPACGLTLVRRRGFQVLSCQVTPAGQCPKCRTNIPGLWTAPGVNPENKTN